MNIHKLFTALTALHPLSTEFKNALENELTMVSLPKNHILLEPPKVADHAYFLTHGFAICYRYAEGRKVIGGFWTSGQMVISVKSFFERVPAKEFIQLTVESEILCISHEGVIKLLSKYQEANLIYRRVMTTYYEQSQQRILDLQNLSAFERYQKLLISFPSIEQIISQDQIASYLGITPQSMSRIKRRKK